MPPKLRKLSTNPTKNKRLQPNAKSKKKLPRSETFVSQHSNTGGESGYDLRKQEVIPHDQLNLQEKELEETHVRILKAMDPNAPKNIAYYHYDERKYKFEAQVEQTAIHVAIDGYLIRKDGDEAKEMKEMEERKRVAKEERKALRIQEGDVSMNEDDEDQLKNQFNFCSRSTQTFNQPLQDAQLETDPPRIMDFCASATQWEIYHAYIEMMEQQKLNMNKKRSKRTRTAEEDTQQELKKVSQKKSSSEIIHSREMAKSVKLMERMINQNRNEDLLEDFKFWEDESDRFKPGGLGSLLPLWNFRHEKTRRKHITGLVWNPKYQDLFAVSFGSYEFMKQSTGAIACYSLKNPSHPEFFIQIETGILSIDFHKQHPSLLCVGFYDGSVGIYDVKNKKRPLLCRSTVENRKHNDVVWQVSWEESPKPHMLQFNSISADGRVSAWSFSKNKLECTDLLPLKLEDLPSIELSASDTENLGLASGTCFEFHPVNKHTYIVGTEEGNIHLCSKAFNSQYLNTFKGHHMSIYSVRWNYFDHNVFLSASADWSVKLWHKDQPEPLMTFDLGNSVGDVAWAPYSATVFAAVTDDGKVHVYDISKNKHDSLCDQLVVKKAKLTKIAFNPIEPIILVGDDKGLVQTLKLSPNLKKKNLKL